MNKKIFLFVAAIGLLAIALPTTNCQAANIAGGNSLDNAVELKAGTYTGGAIADDTTQYFYVTLGQGQQLTAKVTFVTASEYGTMSTVALYNQDRNQVVEQFEANYSTSTLTADWLVNGDQQSYKYYLKLADDDDGSSSYTLTLTIANKYDGGSSKDAPADFDNALPIAAGTTKGYVTGDDEGGNDTADMFVLSPTASGAYTFTVTPPTDAQLEMTIYDANREVLDSKPGSNAGSILTSTVQATAGSNLFLKIGSYYYSSDTPAEYQLAITAPTTTNTNGSAVNVNQNTNSTDTNGAAVTTNSSNTNTTAATEDKEDSTMLYLIIGGAIILVLLIIIIVVVAKKKKSNTPPAQQPPVNKQ
ncbi:MAG: hypothetical protein WC495_05265 [Patescibacteria group bacterium]